MTPEERRLVDDLHGIEGHEEAIVGAGLDPAPPGDAARGRAARPLPERFVLYLGPPRPGQGPRRARARARRATAPRAARWGWCWPGARRWTCAFRGWVRTTGFVDAAARADLLDACEVVALPSPHESLSLVALEAWRAGRPTLATARSEVLAGQTARSGGGLLYLDAGTYARQLARLAGEPALRAELGAAGHRWTGDHTWDACAARWDALLERVRGPLSPG